MTSINYEEVRTSEKQLLSPLELEREPSTQQQESHDWKRIYGVGLYAVTTILLYADQNLLAPNLSQVANEFGFSDDERDRKLGGDISLAFFLLGAPASLIVGCWGDHQSSNRMVLTAWTIGIGEGACFATYFSKTYQHLYVCRAITGLSLGGALPLMYSVLGDWFRAEDRHVVSAIVGMGTGIGIALGQGVAGFIGPTFGWRLPFLLSEVVWRRRSWIESRTARHLGQVRTRGIRACTRTIHPCSNRRPTTNLWNPALIQCMKQQIGLG